MSDLSPTPEIETALKRYLEIQAEERALREEKQTLQTKIADYMGRAQVDTWYPQIDDNPLKIQRSVRVKVDYDEDLLRERLGERFVELLEPNAKKMSAHLDEVRQRLGPLLSEVGQIGRDQVRSAIERGVARKEEFAGAFEKTERSTVAVLRDRRG